MFFINKKHVLVHTNLTTENNTVHVVREPVVVVVKNNLNVGALNALARTLLRRKRGKRGKRGKMRKEGKDEERNAEKGK